MGKVGSSFQLRRLEGLSDGIFAIAMTLLVLNIPLPGSEHTVESDGELFEFLLGLGSLYQTFLISFLMLGIFWIIQQKLYRNLKSTCSLHLWVSLGGLLFVCLIPFSSSLIGKYDDYFVANCFFHLNVFCIGVFMLLQWVIVLRHPEMLKEGIASDLPGKAIRLHMVLPMLSPVGIGVAVYSPAWSTLVYAVTPFMVARIRAKG